MKLTAIVTASPAELRQPVLLPGESILQFFIRHNPEEWRKEADRLALSFGLSAAMTSALRAGKLDAAGSVQAEVHSFVNNYLPRQLRTIRALDELRKTMQQQPEHSRHELEILCPRQSGSGGDRSAEAAMEKLGAKIILLNSVGRSLNLADILPHANGDLLWTVPGGTRFASSDTVKQIERIVNYFKATPACALYQDAAYCMILRTSVVRDFAERGQPIPVIAEQILPQFRDAGHKASRDQGKDDALCYLEPEFGGKSDTPPAIESAKPWWKSVLGK